MHDMSTFCTEPLTLSENNNIVFKPDYKPPHPTKPRPTKTNLVPRAILKKIKKTSFLRPSYSEKMHWGRGWPQTKDFIFIFFLNVLLETEVNKMTRYVKEYCDVYGLHYPKQHIVDII